MFALDSTFSSFKLFFSSLLLSLFFSLFDSLLVEISGLCGQLMRPATEWHAAAQGSGESGHRKKRFPKQGLVQVV